MTILALVILFAVPVVVLPIMISDGHLGVWIRVQVFTLVLLAFFMSASWLFVNALRSEMSNKAGPAAQPYQEGQR
jgi:hypothetical protein